MYFDFPFSDRLKNHGVLLRQKQTFQLNTFRIVKKADASKLRIKM